MDPLNKGVGWLKCAAEPIPAEALAADGVQAHGWSLLREEVSLPAAVLSRTRLQHNAEWMQQFIGRYGLKLAPHGKTTMAPRLFHLQMETGAWGITLATAQQVRVAYAHGIRRVLMANQLVGRANMDIVSHLLRDSTFEYFCLVDSSEQVRQLQVFFGDRGQRVRVLLELGVAGGRSGVRDDHQMRAVLKALERAPDAIELCGVEIYEGVLKQEAAVREFVQRAVATMRTLVAEGKFDARRAILSGAGSAWYDVVAEGFAAAGFGDAVELVLRPGCYLTHDVGAYQAAQNAILQRSPVAREMRSGLLPALQVWAYVQSTPEPELAIVGIGKRDAAFDAGLPVPALHFRPGEALPVAAPTAWSTTKLMDQHAYVRITPGDDLRVGDMIGFDISHPCLTFDKWRVIPVVDDAYRVVEYIKTFF